MPGFGLFIYLAFIGFSLFIYYLVVKAAINDSEATQLLREIRNSLNGIRQEVGSIRGDINVNMNSNVGSSTDASDTSQNSDIDQDSGIDLEENKVCPGCGAVVDPVNDSECRECGLRLK